MPGSRCPAGDDSHEQRALANATAQFRFPVIAALEIVAVEEDVNARGFQSVLDLLGRNPVLAGVAQEHSAGFRRGLRNRLGQRSDLAGQRRRMQVHPSLVEFVYKVECASASVDSRGAAEVAEEEHEVLIVADTAIGDVVAFAPCGKPLSLRHAHQEASQPTSKPAADDQQALAIEFVEEALRTMGLGLQGMEVLDDVFLGYSVSGCCRQLT